MLLFIDAEPWMMAYSILTAILGIILLAMCTIGHYKVTLIWPLRILAFVGSFSLLHQGFISDAFGIVILITIIIIQIIVSRRPNASWVKVLTLGVPYTVFAAMIAFLVIGRFMLAPDMPILCVTNATKTELAFSSAGKVSEVTYSEKQVVSKGVTIARLQDDALIADLKKAETDLLEVNFKFLRIENRLTDMENALAESRVRAAERANEAAKVAFELAREYEKQYRSFLERGAASIAHHNASLRDVANAEAGVKRAENALENARQQLETVKRVPSPEEVAIAKQEADNAAELVAKARTALDGTSLIAPFNAYISNISINTGDVVEEGKTVCEVIDLDGIWLRGLVNKSKMESVKSKSVVNVEFREVPNKTFTGKIVSVTSQPVEQKDGEDLYELRIELDNPDSSVLPDMEATVVVSK